MTIDDRLAAELRAYYRRLPAHLPSDRAAATRAAIRTQGQSRARPRWFLLAVAAVVAASLASSLLVAGSQRELALPTPSETPTITAELSPSPSPSTPEDGRALTAGRLARVTRAFPIGVTEVLPGQSVLIVAGPMDHAGVPSWRIQHYGDLTNGYLPGGLLGWISVDAARTALVPRNPICPPEPLDLARIASIVPFERLLCFGRRDLTFGPVTASTRSHGGELSDRWLSSDGRPDFFTGLPYVMPSSIPGIADGSWVTVTGHFDDESAAACGEPGRVAFCREQFHVTAVVPAEPPAFELRGSWRATALPPIDGRTDHALVWTGSEAVVWGGWASSRDQSVFEAAAPRGGAAYDPASDRWRIVPDAPIAGRGSPIAAWTGTEVLVFGGWAGEKSPLDGAAWNSVTNRWRTIARSPLTGSGTVGAWLDGRLIVVTSSAAAAYDPARDRWTSLPAAPIRPGWRSAAVAAGRLFIVAFGDGATPPVDWAVLDPRADTWTSGEAPIDPLQAGVVFAGAGDRIVVTDIGVTFDPLTMTWATETKCEGVSAGTVWTGRYLLGVTGAWDRAEARCLRLPPAPKREPPFDGSNGREFPVAVWTGDAYITWSGGNGGDIVWVPKDGAVFTPVEDLGP